VAARRVRLQPIYRCAGAWTLRKTDPIGCVAVLATLVEAIGIAGDRNPAGDPGGAVRLLDQLDCEARGPGSPERC
jgi:hypothetical protein